MEMTGQCLCGAVKFTGTPRAGNGISVCHCGQCRRWASGPYTSLRFADGVTLTKSDGLVWFASSDIGERGFCRDCGASLFWRKTGAERHWAVSVGAIGECHEQEIVEHIWIDDKPDFYDFADGAPRKTAAECLAEGG
jgi:hypothetical protein